MSDQEERTPSPFFSRHPSPSLPPTTSTALPAALATPAVPAGPVTPSAPARPANLPRRVRERRPVPNHQLSSVRKLDFNLIPPSMRVAGSHSSLSKYRKRKVRSSQIPSDRFLAKKRYTLGEKKYQQVRAGEMSIYDAMGPGYSLQKDPDTELLASIPRAPEIATLPVRYIYCCPSQPLFTSYIYLNLTSFSLIESASYSLWIAGARVTAYISFWCIGVRCAWLWWLQPTVRRPFCYRLEWKAMFSMEQGRQGLFCPRFCSTSTPVSRTIFTAPRFH